MICTLKRERDGDWQRAVVVVHEVPEREVHAGPWCKDWERAKGHGQRYAKRNDLTVAYSD